MFICKPIFKIFAAHFRTKGILTRNKIIFLCGRFTAWQYATNLLLKDLAYRVGYFFVQIWWRSRFFVSFNQVLLHHSFTDLEKKIKCLHVTATHITPIYGVSENLSSLVERIEGELVDLLLRYFVTFIMYAIIWAPSSEFVSSSIPSWQILTALDQPFRGARDLAFCLKVPLDSLPIWASSGGSGENARMRRLAWTFAARIGDKYQICLTRPNSVISSWCNLKAMIYARGHFYTSPINFTGLYHRHALNFVCFGVSKRSTCRKQFSFT